MNYLLVNLATRIAPVECNTLQGAKLSNAPRGASSVIVHNDGTMKIGELISMEKIIKGMLDAEGMTV